MTGRTFVDTNVLVYAVDRADPVKRSKADAALTALRGEFVLSAQVLGEFYVTVTRKLAMPVDLVDAAERVARLSPRRTVALDATLVRAAIETSRQLQLSYWDALILEAAVAGGCSTILTEDLAAGSVIRGVEVVNPFA